MSENNDSDSSGEWIFVTTEEKPQEVSPPLAESNFQNDGRNTTSQINEIQMESQNQEESISTSAFTTVLEEQDDAHMSCMKADDESSIGSKDSSVSSEVDIIDEEDDGNIASLESSSLSHLSSMANPSVIGTDSDSPGIRGVEVIHEDLSENSLLQNDELTSDVELQAGVRHYVHTPNTRLNVTLNLVLALAVATVIGLGIGNFLGKPRYLDPKQLTYSEVLKLRQLQDELLNCLKHQHEDPVSMTSKLCYENADYWKEKFQNLLDENVSLQEFIHVVQSDMQIKSSKAQEAVHFCSSEAKDEFHKLRLDLIVKQMEHLQLLKSFEVVKHQEMQSQERMKELEEENLELKIRLEDDMEEEALIKELENRVKFLHLENVELKDKLEEENEEDELIRILEKRVRGLAEENTELREALKKLQLELQIINTDVLQQYSLKDRNDFNVVNEKKDGKSSFDLKLNSIRQRINLLIAENEELKAVVARLRYSEPIQQTFYHESVKTKQDEINQEQFHSTSDKGVIQKSESQTNKNSVLDDSVLMSLKEQLENLRDSLSLEVNETKKWKQLFQSIVHQFNNSSQNHENKEHWWRKKLNYYLDSLQEVFTDAQQNLTEKWNDFQNFTKSSGFQKYVSQSKKTVKKVTEMLQHMIKKTHKVGKKMFEKHISPEVKDKVRDIVNALEKKWLGIKEKWYNEMLVVENEFNDADSNQYQPNDDGLDGGIHLEDEKDQSKGELHNLNNMKSEKRDADSAQVHNTKPSKGDWVFKRAQDREAHHKKLAKESRDDWYMRSAKGRSLRRKENAEGSADGS